MSAQRVLKCDDPDDAYRNCHEVTRCLLTPWIQRGYTHSFVLEFASLEDRDYYIREDPAHVVDFGKFLTGTVEEVMVTDIVPNEY